MCPTHKKRCVEREEENYFFALSKYQNQIQVRPNSGGMHTSFMWFQGPDSVRVHLAGLAVNFPGHIRRGHGVMSRWLLAPCRR